MKSLMSLGLMAVLGLVASPVFAQCSSCAGNSPVFSQSYAPVSYGNQMNYAAPNYYPSYSAPAMSYAQPVYSQPQYSQPVYGQSGCSSCCGNSFVSAPVYQNVYSQPMYMNNGCNSCGGGTIVYGGDMGMMGAANSYSDPQMGSGSIVVDGGGVMVPGTMVENNAVLGGSVVTPSEVVTPPAASTDNSIPPVPQPAADAVTPESTPAAAPSPDQPTPDTGDDT